MQEFGEQNPLLCKQLGDAVAKLTEVQRHTTQQVQTRANRLKKVRCPLKVTHVVSMLEQLIHISFKLLPQMLW